MRAIGLSSAFRTLTIVPVPGKDPESQATSLYWFPLVGVVLGAFGYLVALIAFRLSIMIVGASVVVALWAWLTRAFHLDGLADMFDGFGGGWTVEQRLKIMKDSSIGSFGAIALVCVLLLKTASIASFDSEGALIMVLIVPVYGRCLLVLQTVANPYARKEGGTASALVQQARWFHALVAVAIALAFSSLFLRHHGYQLIVVGASGLITTFIVALVSRRKIHGITGDVLGATVELSECAMLLASTIVIRLL